MNLPSNRKVIMITALTFVEGPSELVVPTQTVSIIAGGSVTGTLITYQSCSLGSGGDANCFIDETIAIAGTTTSSEFAQSVTLQINGGSVAGLTATSSPATPTGPPTSGAASKFKLQAGLITLFAGLAVIMY